MRVNNLIEIAIERFFIKKNLSAGKISLSLDRLYYIINFNFTLDFKEGLLGGNKYN